MSLYIELFIKISFFGSLVALVSIKVISYYLVHRKRRKILKTDTSDSIAHPVRQLNENEIQWLTQQIQTEKNHGVRDYISFSLFFTQLVVALVFVIRGLSDPFLFTNFNPILGRIFIIVFQVNLFIFMPHNKIFSSISNPTLDTLLTQYKKDLSEPVMQIKGLAVIDHIFRDKTHIDHYVLRIHNYKFYYPAVTSFIKSIKEGDSIAIEYSPNSHHIWKEEKI